MHFDYRYNKNICYIWVTQLIVKTNLNLPYPKWILKPPSHSFCISFFLIFLISLMGINYVFAQKCKNVKKETLDKRYNGRVLKQTAGITFYSKLSKTGMLTFLEMKDYMIMKVLISRLYGRSLDYKKTDPFIIFFNDSSQINLYPSFNYNGSTGMGNALYETHDLISYNLKTDDIDKIANIQAIRVEIHYSRNAKGD